LAACSAGRSKGFIVFVSSITAPTMIGFLTAAPLDVATATPDETSARLSAIATTRPYLAPC